MALKGRHHLYAIESRTYQKNRALLMVPASQAVPAIPADMLAAPTLGEVLQDHSQTSTLPAGQGSAVCDANEHSGIGLTGQSVTDAAVHPANLGMANYSFWSTTWAILPTIIPPTILRLAS